MIIAVSTRHIFALLSYIKCPYCSTAIFIFFQNLHIVQKYHTFSRKCPVRSAVIRQLPGTSAKKGLTAHGKNCMMLSVTICYYF